jgi:AcrR family transcriptional regulator
MSLEQPTGKRTRMRGEERRESILRSARHVFARCGYAGGEHR